MGIFFPKLEEPQPSEPMEIQPMQIQQRNKQIRKQSKPSFTTKSNNDKMKDKFSKNLRNNLRTKYRKNLQSLKTEQTIQNEHPEFFDKLTYQLLITPVTPNFKGDLQKHKMDETIDLRSLKKIGKTDRYPFTNIQVTQQNLYKRNKQLQKKIKNYMEDDKNNIDPRVVDKWKRLKEANRYLEKNADEVQKKNGGFAPGESIRKKFFTTSDGREILYDELNNIEYVMTRAQR